MTCSEVTICDVPGGFGGVVRTTEGIDWITMVLQVTFAALAVSLYSNFRVARAARWGSD